MNRFRDAMLAYRSMASGVTQIFAFAFAGVGVTFAIAAAADLVFDLRWGYGWATAGGGIVFALAGLGLVWLTRQFKRVLDRFFPR
jgi:hypothetical protein